MRIINPISQKPPGKNVFMVKRSQLLSVIKSSGITKAANFIEAMTQLLDTSIMDTMGMVVKGSYVDPDSTAVVPSTSSTPDPSQQETFQSALVPVVQMINQTFDTFLDKLEMRRVQERKEEQICRERENEARRKEEETRRKEEREEIERIRQEDIRRADEQRKQDMEQRVMEMKLDAEQRDREIKRQTEKHEREIQIQVQQREREFQMKMKAEAEQREREAEQRERELKLQTEQREREMKLQAEQREREAEQRERELKLQAEQRERDQIREEQRMQLLIKLMKESKQGPTAARPPADRVMYSESSKIVTDVVAFFADQTDETILHFKRTSKGLMGMRKNFLRSGKKEGVGSLLFLSSGKISTEELMTAIKKTNIITSSHNKVSTNNKADFFVELKRGLAYEKTWTPGQSEGFTAGDNQLINTL
ncbi:ORF39 [Haliotid herpesvirus 1]|nr:ORF39 [Haliotid herpesvirus 1]